MGDASALMNRLRNPLATFIAVAALAGCDEPQTAMAPVHRFADAMLAPGAPAVHKTIRDDTRIAIGTRPSASLAHARTTTGDEVELELPKALAGAAEVVVAGVLEDERGTHPLAARVVAVDPASGPHGGLRLELSSDERPVGPGKLYLRGQPPQPTPVHVLTSAPVDVPKHSYLQMGLGILEAAWEQGAVEFSVELCEANRWTHERSPLFL